MLKLPANVADALCDAVPKILACLPVDKVLLFGSYTSGTFTDQSDIDLAVFLEDGFVDLLDAYRTVSRILRNYKLDFQPQVFNTQELITPIGILEEIYEHGIDITNTSVIEF